MDKIFQLVGPRSLCPHLASLLITCQYFPREDRSISFVTTCFHFILVASCVYLAIKLPICMRKIIVTIRKIATITLLDTACLMFMQYVQREYN